MTLDQWDETQLKRLRLNPKTSLFYGWIREILPKSLTFHVPGKIGVGHELYALAERPVHNSD
jgi:hypothetical protein